MRAILALALLASALVGQHNGQKSWPVKDFVMVVSGQQRPYLLFRTAHGADMVPLASGFLHGTEFVVRTRTAMQTSGGWVNYPSHAVTLVTHADAELHAACTIELFEGPAATVMAPPSTFEIYYVDEHWHVHKVSTARKPRETRRSWVRRHVANLKEYTKAFPPHIENTKKWALARAASNKTGK